MATGTIALGPNSAILPDGSTGNAAPGMVRFQGTEANPKKHYLALAYDGAGGKEMAYWAFRMPTDYVSGGAVKIQWTVNSTTAANVVWQAQLGAVTPADADTPVEHALAAASTVTTAVNTTEARRLIESSITLGNLDSVAAGDLVFLCILRDSAHASDSCTVDAELIVAALEYTTA